jgi:membrane-bound lytic murein transglycosylase D
MLKKIVQEFKNISFSNKRVWITILLAVLLMLPLEFFIFSSKFVADDEINRKLFLANNKIFSIAIPKNLVFANEKIPIYDFTVLESMERELLVNTYFHSQTILIHKRANRWLPFIASILKKNEVPEDFKYVALVESNLTNNVSPKGAAGFWQFIVGSGKQFGLEINDDVDERYNIEKATEAACKYFKEAYRTFNNWTLAAASYNMGIDGLKNQMEKQKANTYYDLYLNEETARYIFRILAIKEIISNPKDYGYQLRNKDLYPFIATQKIRVDSSITDLVGFAIKNNSNYKILKYFNPWLKNISLINRDKKTYFIEFPKPGYNENYLSLLTTSTDILETKTEKLPVNIPQSPADSIPHNE